MATLLFDSKIAERLRELNSLSRIVKIAVPFWGREASKLLNAKLATQRTPVTIICNLESGACDPAAIRYMRDTLKYTCLTNRRLHAKVYICKNVAVVGSANASANALFSVGTQHLREMCVEIDDKKILSELNKWFEDLRDDPGTIEVGDAELESAEELYNARKIAMAAVDRRKKVTLSALDAAGSAQFQYDTIRVWIYKSDETSSEANRFRSSFIRAGFDDIYEIEDDPKKLDYELIVDGEIQKGGKIFPELWCIDRLKAKKLKNGYWVVPCRRIAKDDSASHLLDTNMKRRIVEQFNRTKPEIVENLDWDMMLGTFISNRYDKSKDTLSLDYA